MGKKEFEDALYALVGAVISEHQAEVEGAYDEAQEFHDLGEFQFKKIIDAYNAQLFRPGPPA